MFKKTKKFIKKLQNSDERTKRRWLWILSGGTIAIVVVLWGFYINASIVSLGSVTSIKDTDVATLPTPAVETNINVSKFGAIFRNYFRMARNELKIITARLKSEMGLASISKVFTIKNLRPDFTLDTLPELPHQNLP